MLELFLTNLLLCKLHMNHYSFLNSCLPPLQKMHRRQSALFQQFRELPVGKKNLYLSYYFFSTRKNGFDTAHALASVASRVI